MEIKNNLLYLNGKQVQMRKSPNIGDKLKSQKYLVIHYTATSSASSAINWLTDPQSMVSAHLHLDKEGVFVQMVDFDTTAWHVGVSEHNGLTGLNSYSIGIEISNTGSEPYTEKQLDALVEVGIALNETYHFDEILAHSEVAIPLGRKQDPGKLFPMEWYREQVFGEKVNESIKDTTTDVNSITG